MTLSCPVGNSVCTQFANGPRTSPFLRYYFGVAAGLVGNGVLSPFAGILK